MAEKRNLTTKTTIDNLLGQIKSTFTKKTTFNTLNNKVTTLIGDDTNKSVRTIANEELAAQLIPASADEALDTLQEIAAWIQNHPGDASAMNAAIVALQNKVTLGKPSDYVAAEGTAVAGTTYYSDTNGTAVDPQPEVGADVTGMFVAGPEYTTVKAYVEAAIAALNIGNYALAADLTNLAGRVTALEEVGSTKVESSETNGNIKVDGSELTVYTLPGNVVKTTDIAAYDSTKNGFIKVQGAYTTVYVLPNDVLHESDIEEYSAAQIALMLEDATFTLSANSGSTTVGNTTVFTSTVPNTTTLTAVSGNEAIATVISGTTADGDNTVYTFTVTGVAAGTANINVATTANPYAIETFTVTVTE